MVPAAALTVMVTPPPSVPLRVMVRVLPLMEAVARVLLEELALKFPSPLKLIVTVLVALTTSVSEKLTLVGFRVMVEAALEIVALTSPEASL